MKRPPGNTIYCSVCGHESFVAHSAAWPYDCSKCGARSWQGSKPVTTAAPTTNGKQ